MSCAPHVGALIPEVLQVAGSRLRPLVLALGLVAGPAGAADVYWDVNGGTAGQGGGGTWNLNDINWNQSSDGVAGPFRSWVDGDTAVFAGTAGTVTVDGTINTGGFSFTTADYTLNGGAVALGGASPTISNTGKVTIGSSLTGSSGVVKNGAGQLVLNGTNTFTGGLRVDAGALVVNSDAALGAVGNGVTMAGGTDLDSSTKLSADRSITLESGVVTIRGEVGSAKYTGAGAMLVASGVRLDNDANDFTGGVTFSVNGDAYFSSVGNVGEASSLGSDGTITFTARDQYMDRLHYVGDGDTSNRNWIISHGGGTTGAVFLQNGSGTLTLSGDMQNQVGGGRALTISAQSGDLELLGQLSSTNDTAFNFSGGGEQRSITLGGDNTYDGATIIGHETNASWNPTGTVTVRVETLADTGVASSFGTGQAGGITLLNGSKVSYIGTGSSSNRSWTIGSETGEAGGGILNDGTGALALSGDVALSEVSGNQLTLGGSFLGTNLISGSITGTGDLVLDGAEGNIWALSGNNTRSGAITVQGGTLRADSASAFGTVGDVTVNGGTLDLNNFNLDAQALAGSGGTLALSNANLSVNHDSGVDTVFAGAITGSGGVTKQGAGTLTLTGGNTYTGDTTVAGGTLALDFSAAGAPVSDIIASSSTLNMAGGVLAVTGAGGVASAQSFSGMNVAGGNNTVSATAGSGGSLNVNMGAITHGGGLVDFVNSGGGNITTSNTALGGWATVNGTDYAKVEGGNIVAFTEADYTDNDNASTWADGQYITDVSGFYDTVGTTVQLAGLRYTEATETTVTVAAGQTLGVDGTIIVAPTVVANDQTITGGALTGTSNGGELGIQQNSTGNFTIASQIVDNGGSVGFTKAGTGLVTLTNASNNYTGATMVGEGSLSVANIGNGGVASGIGASSADAANLVIQGATLQYTGGTSTTDRGFTVGRAGAIGSGTIEVTQTVTNLTFVGEVVGADNGGLTKTGSGTLTLTNANSSYTGVTTVNGGTLAVAALRDGGVNSSIGASTGDSANLVLSNGGTLDYIGGTATTDRGLQLGAGGGAVGVSSAGSVLTVSGVIENQDALDRRLVKKGDGTLVLSGTNTYSGGTFVEAGTLLAGSTQAFGSPTAVMNVVNGATLNLNGFDNTVGVLTGAGDVDLGSAMLTSNATGGVFSGTISGTGSITRTGGGGTQTFTGANNTYTGATIVDSGYLSVDNLANGGLASSIGASTSDSSNLVIKRNGRLTYSGDSVATDRGFTLEQGDGRVNVSNVVTNLEFSGNVVGPGNLRKQGDGTMVLSGVNTYTGLTLIDQGVLRAGVTNAFGPDTKTNGVYIANYAGAGLDLDGFDTTIADLYGAGTSGGNVELGDATLTIGLGNNSATRIYSGAINGTGNLVKNGTAVLRLHGCDSSYSGGTTINGGSIETSCLDDGGVNSSIGASTADASNLVLNGGALRYVGAGDSTNREFTLGAAGGTLDASGTGALNFTSTAPITLDGADTARTFALTGTNADDNTLAALIENNGAGVTSLAKTGTGTWRLTNPDSTYTGVTTINGGVLSVDKLANGGLASSIGASSDSASNLVIGNNSTLRYTGSGDTTDRLFTLATGVAFIESSGTGAVVFDNTDPVTYSGSGARTVGLGGSNTGLNTLGGTIGDGAGGVTTLAKNGAGTWVLTGDNTYTGNTVINNGNLIVGNGGTTGNVGTGNVVVDAATSTLSLNRSDTFTFDGALSGPGTLAQIGSGTSVLTSTTNAIGATVISAGTLQVDGGLATPTIAMTGSSTLDVNGIVQAAGVTPAVLIGDTGVNTVNVNAGGTLRANGDLGDGTDTVALAGALDTGAGALALGDGDDTLTLRDGAQINGAVLAGAGVDRLEVNNAVVLTLDGASVGGFESLNKQNTGILTLTGDHSYTDGTTIAAGTVQVGSGGTSGSLASDVANSGTLAFNRSDSYTFSGLISGTGAVNQIGAGTTTLTGNNSYKGVTTVQAGTLLVNGDQTAATDDTTVAGAATLGGTGTIGGNVIVQGDATLSPGTSDGTAGTLNIVGDLELNNTSNLAFNFGEPNVVGGAQNDLVNVGGDLVLDGNLNITETAGGNFGFGIYRVINYQGQLKNNGLNLASTDYVLQTSVANQINLVNAAGYLNFWDGDAGPQNDNMINGGDGTWSRSASALWTTDTGNLNSPYENASLAVFTGAPGNVSIDNTNGQVEAAGMQFAVDGYALTGGALNLVGGMDDPTASTIRVGDGTTEGSGMTATIGVDLSGATTLVKTDLGKLVLSGANSYTGDTRIEDGTISVSSDGNLGAGTGAIEIDGGTLQNTAAFTSARGVTLEDEGGTFLTDANLALSGIIGGAGALSKSGAGTLTLSGANGYAGGTHIDEGTLSISSDGNLGTGTSAVTLDGGTLQNTAAFTSSRAVTLETGGGTFETDAGLILSGVISGTGSLTKTGTDMLALTAENTYVGGTTISGGTLQLGNGGTSGAIQGDVANAGTLAFNRSDVHTFDGQISGSGMVNHVGAGTTILTNTHTYAGQTTVQSGTLMINGDQSGATGETSVISGATLGGTGIIGGDVDVGANSAVRPGGMDVTPGTLAINGSLTLADTSDLNYNFGQAGVVGGAFNDLITVKGDLELDGVLNVTETAGGEFGPGLYRIISYDGSLTNGGLVLGAMPAGDFRVQTSVAQQVNLVNTTGLTLNFWDGPDGGINDSDIHGGDGEWNLAAAERWTTDTGAVNAPYANGTFAVFAGEPGAVTVNNGSGSVEAQGMQFATDGYTISGDDLTLVGNTSGAAIIRVGDGTLAGADMTANVDVSLGGNAMLEKTDLGTLVLAGVNGYTGGTAIKGGTIRVSQDANLGDAAGVLSLDGGTLHTTASFDSARNLDLASTGTIVTDDATALTLNGALAGAGGLTKAGAGALVLNGTSTYAGATTVAAGVLRAGAADAFSASSDYSVLSGGELDLAGSSQTVGSLSNAGAVRLSGAPGASLTVNGDYAGDRGLIAINTVLGDDGSATDRLVVSGDTSGSTNLRVANVGGAGAPTIEGIKIVDVGGTSNGDFSLQGDYVFQGDQAMVAGAYAYRLYKNGVGTPADGDWYLRSSLTDPQDPAGPSVPGNPGNPDGTTQPLYQPGVPVYEAYAGALQSFNQLGTLQQRVGSRSWKDQGNAQALPDGSIDANGIWARVEAGNAKFDPDVTTSGTDYDANTWKIQVGIDGTISQNERGRTVLGVYTQYGTIDSDMDSIHGKGAIDTKGYSLGGTLTWYGNSGAYLDSHAQVTRYDSDLRSRTGGRNLIDGNDGMGYALSVEGGKRIALGGPWSLTPQAQLSYSSVDFDDFTDPFGADVSLDKSESLVGRLGLAIDHETEWSGAGGQTGRSRIFGIANVYYDFADGSNVQVGGTKFKSENDALRGGIGLGWSLNSSDNKYSFYAEALANTSLRNFGDSNEVKGTVGVRVRW